MKVPLNQLLVIIFIQIVKNIDSSEIVCTKWDNDISLTSEEIKILISYLGDSLPIFNNASTEFNFTAAIQSYQHHEQDDDLHLNITELINKNGYKTEEHYVVTSDGYILCLIRIVGDGPVVFLMHGLISSAADWITAMKERALGLLLAALGYEVWLGNARGNFYSRRHLFLTPDCKEFWDFSWHEIGIYDLPAMIDHVLKETNQAALYYIGHSQGTTSFFVMCSMKPEYNKKIIEMIALSPVAWMSHMKSPLLQLLSPVFPVAGLVLRAFGVYEFLPRNEILNAFTTLACGTPQTATIFCNNIGFLFCGFDYLQINATYLPLVYSKTPAGSSLKQVVHYTQEVTSGHFRQYDHGCVKNLEIYGSEQPPDYCVEKITAPVYLIQAKNDWLASIIDVRILADKLPNLQQLYTVPLSTFNHMDFMYGKDVKLLVHDKVISILQKQSSSNLTNVNQSSQQRSLVP